MSLRSCGGTPLYGLICFDLSTIGTGCRRSTSSLFVKNSLLQGLWVCGREARECGQPVGRACAVLAVSRRPHGAVHGLSTRLCSGRSAGMRTRPHIHRPMAALLRTYWPRAPSGRLRRWIMLICVDWVPLDFTASRSWPFSKSRDRRSGCPLRDSPVRHRYSPNKGSPHRPRMP